MKNKKNKNLFSDNPSKKHKRLIELLRMSQPELFLHILNILDSKFTYYSDYQNFILIKGNCNITIVAHLDIAGDLPQNIIIRNGLIRQYGNSRNVLGGDDRAGVYICLEYLLNSEQRPHILFTTNEEQGCIGTKTMLEQMPSESVNNILENSMFFIQLDRRNHNDCVFYNYEPKEFIEYIENFGFKEQYGSYSDITELGEFYNICGVNLSVGYNNEHTANETLNFHTLHATAIKTKSIILDAIESNIQWTTWTDEDTKEDYNGNKELEFDNDYMDNEHMEELEDIEQLKNFVKDRSVQE